MLKSGHVLSPDYPRKANAYHLFVLRDTGQRSRPVKAVPLALPHRFPATFYTMQSFMVSSHFPSANLLYSIQVTAGETFPGRKEQLWELVYIGWLP